MSHDFEKVISRRDHHSAKWKSVPEDYIALTVADTDFKAPPEVIEKMVSMAEHGIYGYAPAPAPAGRFCKAVKNWYKTHHKIDLGDAYIHHSPGLMTNSLWMLLEMASLPGEGVIIQPPVYHCFAGVIKGSQREPVENHLINRDGTYYIDFEDLENKCKDEKNKVLVLCNPANPVGQVWSREDLEKILDLCNTYGVFCISDEIHSDMIHGTTFTSILEVAKPGDENVALISSPSKTFNIAGFFTSYVIFPGENRNREYEAMCQRYPSAFNYMGVEALITAYHQCHDYVEKLNKAIRENFIFVKEFIDERMPKLQVNIPQCSYLLWICVKDLGLSCEEIRQFLEEAKVALNCGEIYGGDGDHYVRLNAGVPKSLLKEALERIEKVYVQRGY